MDGNRRPKGVWKFLSLVSGSKTNSDLTEEVSPIFVLLMGSRTVAVSLVLMLSHSFKTTLFSFQQSFEKIKTRILIFF